MWLLHRVNLETNINGMKYKQEALVLFIAFFLFGCNQETTDKDFNKFTGLWSLYIMERQNLKSGEWHEWRAGMQGYILYDGQSNMAVHHTTVGYEKFDLQYANFTDSISVEALKHLTNSLVYFAKYTVDDEQKVVEHARISHSNPSQWNQVVKRRYTFSGDTLTLQPIEEGPLGILRLRWIKESVDVKD